MAKKTAFIPASVKYKAQLEEINASAKAAGCDTDFLYCSTVERYLTLLNLLIKAEKEIDGKLTIVKITPKGSEMEVPNPAIQIYNQTASAANSTVSTLLRIVQTYKFKAAKADDDDDL